MTLLALVIAVFWTLAASLCLPLPWAVAVGVLAFCVSWFWLGMCKVAGREE